MKIKSFLVTVFACITCNAIYAQDAQKDSIVIANEDSCNVENIQSAIDACLLLAKGVYSQNFDNIEMAAKQMRKCKMIDSSFLRKQDSAQDTLRGHMVFNTEFADYILHYDEQGYTDIYNPIGDAISLADKFSKKTAHRGQMQQGQILTKTCFVKANGKSVYTFNSHDRQELAIVAEPGGLVTTRIHAVNKQAGINEWHNDTADVAKGRNSRKTAFTLPHSPRSQVTLEITNCTNKDISVVVISN